MNLPCISTLIGRDIDAQDEIEAAIDEMADLFFDEWADREDVPNNLRDDDEFRQDWALAALNWESAHGNLSRFDFDWSEQEEIE